MRTRKAKKEDALLPNNWAEQNFAIVEKSKIHTNQIIRHLDDAYYFFIRRWSDKRLASKKEVAVIFMNSAQLIIAFQFVTVTDKFPSEQIITNAMLHKADRIIVAHNSITEVVLPVKGDGKNVHELYMLCKQIGIELADYMIITARYGQPSLYHSYKLDAAQGFISYNNLDYIINDHNWI